MKIHYPIISADYCSEKLVSEESLKSVAIVCARGVWSLKFLSPTLLLLRLNIL